MKRCPSRARRRTHEETGWRAAGSSRNRVIGLLRKPPPRVTVFSGTTSQWVAPTCFSWEGDIDAQQCLTQAAERATQGQTKRLNVIPEKVVGISVDPSVAESGWYPTVGGQRLTQDTLNETYFRFSFPRVPASPQGYPLAIVSEGEQKGLGRPVGRPARLPRTQTSS